MAVAVAVQHVNGTLELIALAFPGPGYLSLMIFALLNADIHPYGYGNENPESIASPITLHDQSPKNEFSIDHIIEIIKQEITKLVTIISNQNIIIDHYQISTAYEDRVMIAIQQSPLPPPTSRPSPSDFAAYSSLNNTVCRRHFEIDCKPYDYNPHPLDVVLRGSHAADIKFQKAVEAALVDIFDWDMKYKAKDRIGIRGVKQINTNLKETTYVSAFGAARVAKMKIDEPKPQGCNSEEVECTRIRKGVLKESFAKREMSKQEGGGERKVRVWRDRGEL
ncbi:hypothetical protein NHQ30_004236 [Ciborinia camelliae]|nr:hypothetical protein NHQ30_004236 [Ciborinia camelliae]